MSILDTLGLTEVPRETLLKKYTTPDSRFVDVMNTKIHVRDEGSGPVLLMIHGFAASLHTWDACAEALKKQYRVVRFDMPPFGLSGPVRDQQGRLVRMNQALYREIVLGVMNAMGIDKATLIGNSMGGLLSWDMAAEHPDRVEAIVLSDAVGFTQRLPIYVRLFTFKALNLLAPYSLPTPVLEMAIRDVYGDKSRIKPAMIQLYLDLFMQKANRSGIGKMIHVLSDMSFGNERLKNICCPALVVWGEQDRWVPISSAHKFVKEIPNAQLATYPGVGHIPMEEVPELFIRDVSAFLNSIQQ